MDEGPRGNKMASRRPKIGQHGRHIKLPQTSGHLIENCACNLTFALDCKAILSIGKENSAGLSIRLASEAP